MRLSIDFNWPPGFARVTVGEPNIKDKNIEFRVGVILDSDRKHVRWLKPGWFSGEYKEDIKLDLNKRDKVVVERKDKGTENIKTRNTWDISEYWPPEARGVSFTNIPWYF